MLQEFTLNRGRAIINFTSKYCDNRRKILTSSMTPSSGASAMKTSSSVTSWRSSA